MLALSLAPRVAVPAEPPSERPPADEVFRTFEKRVQGAQSVFVAYLGERTSKKGQEIERSYYGGTYHVRPGIELVMRPFNPSNQYVRSWIVVPMANYFGPVTRQGFLDNLTSRMFVDLFLPPVTDFKLVKRKAGADPAGSMIIAYTVYLHAVEKTPAVAKQVTLWLDEKSLTVKLDGNRHGFLELSDTVHAITLPLGEPRGREVRKLDA
jgi:hypothetical protein